MIKIYCDKCGEELKIGFFKLGSEWSEAIRINDDKYHLCPKCYNKFIDWKNTSK